MQQDSDNKYQQEPEDDSRLIEILQRSQLVQREMQNMIDILNKKNAVITQKNAELTIQNETWNRVSDSADMVDMSMVAKLLNFKGTGRNKLFDSLRGMGILRHNNEPYQQYITNGYFEVVEQEVTTPYGNTLVNKKTVVTQKGIDYINKKMLEAGYEHADR